MNKTLFSSAGHIVVQQYHKDMTSAKPAMILAATQKKDENVKNQTFAVYYVTANGELYKRDTPKVLRVV